MSSNLTFKNNLNTEFKIEHKDNEVAKTIHASDISYTRKLVTDLSAIVPVGATLSDYDGQVVVVTDLNRGGTFIYDSAQSAVNNGGTIFDGWVRQYSGAVKLGWWDVNTTDSVHVELLQALAIGEVEVSEIYTLNQTVTIPIGGSIVGSGVLQLIGFKADSTFTGDYLFTTVKNTNIKHLTLTGTESIVLGDIADLVNSYFNNYDTAVARADITGVGGVYISGNNINVSNCYFTQFSSYGINTSLNNVDSQQPINRLITENTFYLNVCGTNQEEESEYARISDNVYKFNYYGVIVIGGNNSYSNNKIDHNRLNVLLLSGANDSHGEFTGGSINHGKLGAVIIDTIRNGELFTGVSIFDGGTLGFYIKESRGVQVTNCILSRVNFTNDGGYSGDGANVGVNKVSNCLFGLLGGTYTTTELSTNSPSNLRMHHNNMLEGDDETVWDNDLLNNSKYDEELWSVTNSNGVDIVSGKNPINWYVGGTAVTGALAIKLPIGFNNSIISMDVKITDLSGKNANYTISGYMVSGGSWYNCTVSANKGDVTSIVNFGKDTTGGEAIIYIGELTGSYRYQRIEVTNFSMHFGALDEKKYWKYGWEVYIESTALDTVTNTVIAPTEYPQFGGGTDDLDDITYNYETFVFGGSTANVPVGLDGFLTSRAKLSGSGKGMQTYVTVTGVMYVRGNNSGWSAWVLAT